MNPQVNGTHEEPRPCASNGRTRRRALVACRQCSLRKVRCDVSTAGTPCGNCACDQVVCTIVPRRKRRGRLTTVVPNAEANTRHEHDSSPFQRYQNPVSTQAVDQILPSLADTPIEAAHYPTASCSGAHDTISTNVEYLSDEGENVDTYAKALGTPRSPRDDQIPALFYFGCKQGMGGFMFDMNDVCADQRGTHYLLSLSAAKGISPQDDAYLKANGAYSMPDDDTCDALLRCYFRHVHPFMPILDVQTFLSEYLQNGVRKMSLLLVWSIFFATSNFVDPDLMQKFRFATRKAMKRDLYRRAKILYDCDFEKDKITLIQSLLLIGLWYTDTDDRIGAWHWTGISISLSQSIGLHRRLQLVESHYTLPERSESVYRRIWWTCVVRDRWLSLAKGQPLRINIADCDVAMPSLSDFTDDIVVMDLNIRHRYIPSEPHTLARSWLRLVKISTALGSVLQTHYKISGPRPGVQDIQSCEKEIASCCDDAPGLVQTDTTTYLFQSQLQLLHEAVKIVLYRPYILQGPAHPESAVTELWQQKSRNHARTAAATTTWILENLLEMNGVEYMKPMTITSLIPAMQVHILDCRSSNALVRRFATQKIRLCMTFMSQLRHTYWGADFALKMFQQALARVQEKYKSQEQSQRLFANGSAQTETPDLEMHNDLEVLLPGPRVTIGDPLETASASYGMAHIQPSYGNAGSEEPNDWLMGCEDFSSVFLNMV